MMMNTETQTTYRLMVAIEPVDETELPASVEDRYFGSLSEVLSRCCWPWTDGVSFAVYQKQSDGSWLLYYHSI